MEIIPIFAFICSSYLLMITQYLSKKVNIDQKLAMFVPIVFGMVIFRYVISKYIDNCSDVIFYLSMYGLLCICLITNLIILQSIFMYRIHKQKRGR